MILKIKYTTDKNTIKERIVFSVLESGDIGPYFVFNVAKIGSDQISSEVLYPFWFPDKQVNKGDLVVLYTKAGETGFKTNKDLSQTHFFYRNISSPIFTEDYFALLVKSTEREVEE